MNIDNLSPIVRKLREPLNRDSMYMNILSTPIDSDSQKIENNRKRMYHNQEARMLWVYSIFIALFILLQSSWEILELAEYCIHRENHTSLISHTMFESQRIRDGLVVYMFSRSEF